MAEKCKKLTVLHVREREEHCSLVSVETVDDNHIAEAIGADYAELYHRRVGEERKEYVIICDGIGRIRERAPTAIVRTAEMPVVSFVGDILVCKEDGDDLASITAEDAIYLLTSMIMCTYKGAPIACLEVDR